MPEENNKQENPSPPFAAVKSPFDERDILFTDVAFASEPFDWSKGVNIEKEMAEAISKPDFKIPAKDQDGSGSCGGQAESYGGAAIETINSKSFEERSAKFTYAPVAYKPGGGSTGRDLAARAKDAGWGLESLTPSYDNGKPPSEAFMSRAQDITVEAIEEAKKSRAMSYTILPVDIDEIAKAIRDYKFVRIGITGSNNGTWYTTDPKPPKDTDARWYHWIACVRAEMRNGKKMIGFMNSWGTAVGDKGLQWLDEEWFKPRLSNDPYGSIPLWEPRCYVWNPQPAPPDFKHKFFKELDYLDIDPECIALQKALTVDGTFPASVPYATRFGDQTRLAVQKFQKKYNIAWSGTPKTTGYGRVGPKTIKKLNELFDK